MILLNPTKLSRQYPNERSLEVMTSTIDFFEKKGKKRLKDDAHQRVWRDHVDALTVAYEMNPQAIPLAGKVTAPRLSRPNVCERECLPELVQRTDEGLDWQCSLMSCLASRWPRAWRLSHE
jgi:hypothetical protein